MVANGAGVSMYHWDYDVLFVTSLWIIGNDIHVVAIALPHKLS